MAAGGNLKVRIVQMSKRHSTATFSCGERDIDRWCKKFALAEHLGHKSRVFVATPIGSNKIVGIYSLSHRNIAATSLSRGGSNSAKELPAIYFATLGVCTSSGGRGVGAALMTDAFKRVTRVSRNVGGYHSLWLESLTEAAVGFYERHQFTRFKPGDKRMFVLMDTLRDALKR